MYGIYVKNVYKKKYNNNKLYTEYEVMFNHNRFFGQNVLYRNFTTECTINSSFF